MVLKTITFEFYEPWGQGFRTFNGWVYYMVNGSEYQVYEIRESASGVKEHVLLAHYTKSKIKNVTEKIL